ncbi:hypothetical protein JTE90_007361 [Oedothorax gibbosus]|uniref:Uncharacterized protein n=1 Tax=Oedothorax gibbosus TaxID=931172 RepID=A0AAV6TCH6_9ARAC|nr:hypothetical protein JTE90_007361 [Oedothorax gibbosus]
MSLGGKLTKFFIWILKNWFSWEFPKLAPGSRALYEVDNAFPKISQHLITKGFPKTGLGENPPFTPKKKGLALKPIPSLIESFLKRRPGREKGFPQNIRSINHPPCPHAPHPAPLPALGIKW